MKWRKGWKRDVLFFALILFVSIQVLGGGVLASALVPRPMTAPQIAAGLSFPAVGISTLAFGARHPRSLLTAAFAFPLIFLWVTVAFFERFVIVAAFAIFLLILSPYFFVHYLRQVREERRKLKGEDSQRGRPPPREEDI